MNSDAAAVIVGLGSGIGLILLLGVTSSSSFEHYGPPTLLMFVEGKEYKMGYGSYTLSRPLPFGGGFGADIDSSRTLPKEIVSIRTNSLIHFSFGAFTLARNVELRNGWLLDSSNHQYFLEIDGPDGSRIPTDIPNGDYVLSVTGYWSASGYSWNGSFSSKVRILS